MKEFISEMEASAVRNCHLLISSFLVSVHECGWIFLSAFVCPSVLLQTVSCCSHHYAVVQCKIENLFYNIFIGTME